MKWYIVAELIYTHNAIFTPPFLNLHTVFWFEPETLLNKFNGLNVDTDAERITTWYLENVIYYNYLKSGWKPYYYVQ